MANSSQSPIWYRSTKTIEADTLAFNLNEIAVISFVNSKVTLTDFYKKVDREVDQLYGKEDLQKLLSKFPDQWLLDNEEGNVRWFNLSQIKAFLYKKNAQDELYVDIIHDGDNGLTSITNPQTLARLEEIIVGKPKKSAQITTPSTAF
jgi:hypothetical protein